GGAGHLAGELLKMMAQIDIVHVPYKGGGPAMQGFLGGQVASFFATPVSSIAQIKAGKARPIATTGSKRAALMPDVPTIAESGYPGYEALNWYAYLGPARLPKDLVDRLNRELVKWLSSVFMVSIGFSVLAQDRPQTSQPQSQLQFEEQERRALEQETRAVDLQYSTKPIRVILGVREYMIPANYFGSKGRDTRDVFDAGKTGYGFRLFLPDYGGYTNENWRDKFDRRLIEI